MYLQRTQTLRKSAIFIKFWQTLAGVIECQERDLGHAPMRAVTHTKNWKTHCLNWVRKVVKKSQIFKLISKLQNLSQFIGVFQYLI
jgi:hypothetical protein